MKQNLTLAIEQDVLHRARLVAAHKKKTLTGMVREYLEHLAREDRERKESLDRLLKTMRSKPLRVGKTDWNRDNLHAR